MEAAGKRYIWHASKMDSFRIWNLADLHMGAKGCAEKDIRRDVQEILGDPYSFWMGGGDFADFIGYRDKRFDPDAMAEWISVKDLGDLGKKCMTRVRDMLLPIRHKCLGLLLGNHELKYELHTEHESLHHWLCQEMGAPYLGYCCFFDLHFCTVAGMKSKPRLEVKLPNRRGVERHEESNVFRVFAHHGSGYATTPGGKLNKLINAMSFFDADIYFLGHVHDQIGRPEPAIAADKSCTKIIERVRVGAIAGSYLRTYTQGSIGYGEQKMYRPTNLGAAIVRITPATRKIKVES